MPRGWLAARWRELVHARDDEALLATLEAPQVLRLHGVVESPNTLRAPSCGFACAAVRIALLRREPVTEADPARRDERAMQERYVPLTYAYRGGEIGVRLRQGALVHVAAEHVWLSGPVDASSVPVNQTNLLPEFRHLPELDHDGPGLLMQHELLLVHGEKVSLHGTFAPVRQVEPHGYREQRVTTTLRSHHTVQIQLVLE